jgi:hypothetical protein
MDDSICQSVIVERIRGALFWRSTSWRDPERRPHGRWWSVPSAWAGDDHPNPVARAERPDLLTIGLERRCGHEWEPFTQQMNVASREMVAIFVEIAATGGRS